MSRKGELFRGLTVALVTPFKDGGAIDYAALDRLVDWHVEQGTDGLVPVGSLTDDFYRHDPDRHRLEGQRTGRVFTLGDRVEVRLAEANPVTGGLRFELIEGGQIAAREGRGKQRHTVHRQDRKPPGRRKPPPRRRR